MNILAISTSGRAASAALIRDGIVLRVACSDNGLTHSETIMPLIDSLYSASDASFALDDTQAYACDVGPGSFTGVRIGVCIANSLAFASDKPTVAISSLTALALACQDTGAVCALIDARNGNGYAALYENGRELIPPSAVTIAGILDLVPPGTLFTGDGASIHREAIISAVPDARFADERLYTLTADMLCKPAMALIAAGETLREAAPLYLRPTQAERLYKPKT